MCKVPSFYLALQPQVDWTASSRHIGWDHQQQGGDKVWSQYLVQGDQLFCCGQSAFDRGPSTVWHDYTPYPISMPITSVYKYQRSQIRDQNVFPLCSERAWKRDCRERSNCAILLKWWRFYKNCFPPSTSSHPMSTDRTACHCRYMYNRSREQPPNGQQSHKTSRGCLNWIYRYIPSSLVPRHPAFDCVQYTVPYISYWISNWPITFGQTVQLAKCDWSIHISVLR